MCVCFDGRGRTNAAFPNPTPALYWHTGSPPPHLLNAPSPATSPLHIPSLPHPLFKLVLAFLYTKAKWRCCGIRIKPPSSHPTHPSFLGLYLLSLLSTSLQLRQLLPLLALANCQSDLISPYPSIFFLQSGVRRVSFLPTSSLPFSSFSFSCSFPFSLYSSYVFMLHFFSFFPLFRADVHFLF